MKAAYGSPPPARLNRHHSNSANDRMKISSGSKSHNHRMIMPPFLRLDSTGEITTHDRPIRITSSGQKQRTNTRRQGASGDNAKNGRHSLLGKLMCQFSPQPSPSSSLLPMSQVQNGVCALDHLLNYRPTVDTVAMAGAPSYVKMAQSNTSGQNRYGQWGTMGPNYSSLPRGVFPCHVFRALQSQRESQNHVLSISGQLVFKNGSSVSDSLLDAWPNCTGGNVSSPYLQKSNTVFSTDSFAGYRFKVSPTQSQTSRTTVSCDDSATSCATSATVTSVSNIGRTTRNTRRVPVRDFPSDTMTKMQDRALQRPTIYLKEQASVNSQKCTVGITSSNCVVENQKGQFYSELTGKPPYNESQPLCSTVDFKSDFKPVDLAETICAKEKDEVMDSCACSLTPESKVVTTDNDLHAKELNTSDELKFDPEFQGAECCDIPKEREIPGEKEQSCVATVSWDSGEQETSCDKTKWGSWEESEDEMVREDSDQDQEIWDEFLNNQLSLCMVSCKWNQQKQEDCQDNEPEGNPCTLKPCPTITEKWNQMYSSVSLADRPCKVQFHCGKGKDIVHEYERRDEETLTVMEIQKARDLTRQNKGKAARLLRNKCAQHFEPDDDVVSDGDGSVVGHKNCASDSSLDGEQKMDDGDEDDSTVFFNDGLEDLSFDSGSTLCDSTKGCGLLQEDCDSEEDDSSSSESEEEDKDDEVSDDDDDDDIVFE